MIHSALSLGSEEGIKALQHFVYNARRNGGRKAKTLESDFDLSAPHSGVDIWHTTGALIPRDSGLAHFSALYQQIDVIDNKATLFSITKRVKLAAMAQYRKGLLQVQVRIRLEMSICTSSALYTPTTPRLRDRTTRRQNQGHVTIVTGCATGEEKEGYGLKYEISSVVLAPSWLYLHNAFPTDTL